VIGDGADTFLAWEPLEDEPLDDELFESPELPHAASVTANATAVATGTMPFISLMRPIRSPP
jgi:hypothetical protein